MSIIYYEKDRTFLLNGGNVSYVISIIDDDNFIGHIYFGKRIDYCDMAYMIRGSEYPFLPSHNNRDRIGFVDRFPNEYATEGVGDYRDGCLAVRAANGSTACGLHYNSHKIYKGKPQLTGLPATYGDEKECETLELYCSDDYLKLQVILRYTVFSSLDVVARSVEIVNNDNKEIYLTKVLSMCLELDGMNYDIISLNGAWGRERRPQRSKAGYGKYAVSSTRGVTSHQSHPFLCIPAAGANEDYGEVYGINLIYSGNFIVQAEVDQFSNTRITAGINPVNFEWTLNPGDSFTSPEAILVYSDEGIGKMSRTFHDLYREHLIRGEYRDKQRPILINNWEATYFDFDTDKLLSIAKQAAELGIEMLVMDDGWFGCRDDDNTSLGDWWVNENKLKGGLKYLVDEVNKLGLKFGIWFEPEMVSKDSELNRKHPDWAIQVDGRIGSLSRNQYVLDITRPEVREYVFKCISDILDNANIEYVKWDMNRHLSELGSYGLPADRQGELSHRYVLAVYELMDRLTTKYPKLLLENCSSGGARFDCGMLYYSPQIWCSDDTDAIERLRIQRGTAMVYPLSTMGAHVSDCPNHANGRVTPFETRGYVALAGTFGYELDVTRIPEQDRNMIPEQVEMYHKYNNIVRQGDYYRIANFDDTGDYDCWQIVSKDKSETLITYIQVLGRINCVSMRIRLKGLCEYAVYMDEATGMVYTASVLMNVGFPVPVKNGDFIGKLIHLVRIDEK